VLKDFLKLSTANRAISTAAGNKFGQENKRVTATLHNGKLKPHTNNFIAINNIV